MDPRQSGGSGVRYAVAGLALLALSGFCGAGAIGGLWLWRAGVAPRGSSGGGTAGEPPVAARDPLRPTVDLVYGGACEPNFGGRLVVSTNEQNMLSIGSIIAGRPTGSLLISPGTAQLTGVGGTVDLTAGFFEATQMMVQIADSRGSSGYVSYPVQGGGPISGQLLFREWAPHGGVLDVTFVDVHLVNWQTHAPCTVSGRVVTRGLTGG